MRGSHRQELVIPVDMDYNNILHNRLDFWETHTYHSGSKKWEISRDKCSRYFTDSSFRMPREREGVGFLNLHPFEWDHLIRYTSPLGYTVNSYLDVVVHESDMNTSCTSSAKTYQTDIYCSNLWDSTQTQACCDPVKGWMVLGLLCDSPPYQLTISVRKASVQDVPGTASRA